jgi:hypothetical protein
MGRHVRLLCWAVVLALLCAGRAIAALPAVALVEADISFVADVQSKLIASGQFSTVDIIDASAVTPTVAQLQAYKAVLVWSNSSFAGSVALGNNIDTYLRAGGGVVIAVFANTDPGDLELQGAWATNVDSPMTVLSQSEGVQLTLGTIHVPGSPLLAGVTSFNGGTSSYNDPGTLTPGAIDIADWSNGTPLIATKLINGSLVVALNFFPPSSDARADFWVASTGGTQLMVNALKNAGTAVAAAAAIPTLSVWPMAVLALLLLGAGMWRMRRG